MFNIDTFKAHKQGINMEHEDFKLIALYCYNQMDIEKFEEAISYISNDDGYIAEKWSLFKRDMMSFLMQYKGVYNYICRQIEETDYKG